ncbi:MAG: division/cell wall cluster transcriptional repressor MraZ [candidate division WWE3 bacterium]|nr:division/cell wall cluster transcriptional repressor MraZ [candidate division WWE3 bacterium]
MKLFLGEYQQNFIGTRLAIPKKLREQVEGENFILAKGFEKCLFGYSVNTWEKMSAQQETALISDSKARDLRRYLYSGAQELQFDAQGRVVVPESLRTYADLGEEAVVIGAGDHFEIWDAKFWKSHLTALEATIRNG